MPGVRIGVVTRRRDRRKEKGLRAGVRVSKWGDHMAIVVK